MAEEMVASHVVHNSYRDSVELMQVAAQIERSPGVKRAALLMGSPANKGFLREAGLLTEEASAAGPNDLVIAMAAENAEAAEAALVQAARAVTGKPETPNAGTSESVPPRTIAEAAAELPTANLAMISTPGPYATAEALKALKRGMHVFMFSDNVPVEDEIELKKMAGRKGLLMMGPDCGTSILDGVPLGFANVVRKGGIGLIGASGTGLQQVSCLIDRQGEGVSQVIGVGGHDLSERVGGIMMLAALDRLAADPGTRVIVLLSKPPSPAVAGAVLSKAGQIEKPLVINFLGGDPAAVQNAGATAAGTLEDAAILSVALSRGTPAPHIDREPETTETGSPIRQRVSSLAPGQRFVRGLYSGGTLAAETSVVLAEMLGSKSGLAGHTIIDLGDDEYTVGRPHPMIDSRLRNERIVAAAEDPETAVILLDLVLGYGANPDPAGALVPAIEEARAVAREAGRSIVFVASVCGTEDDPQRLSSQERTLELADVLLAPSNARAARIAGLIAIEAARGNTKDKIAA